MSDKTIIALCVLFGVVTLAAVNIALRVSYKLGRYHYALEVEQMEREISYLDE